jgi:hypothetical protein
MTTEQRQPSRLGLRHGYRFLGDLVELHAELQGVSPATGPWSLQLWADDSQRIAELHLDNLQPDADGNCEVIGLCGAQPPAGQNEHRLSLRLLRHPGLADEVVADQAIYPLTVQFAQPALLGELTADWRDGQLHIAIERLGNLRDADNLSGTLALEVQAGETLGQIVLGSLNGQCDWPAQQFRFPLSQRPQGELQLTLREWTQQGYVTRDQRPLQLPAENKLAAVPAPVPSEPGKVSATTSAANAAPTSAPASVPPVPPVAAGTVSINRASSAELTALKGVGPSLAAAIIAGRPYASLKELSRVKGLGKKLLDKLRPKLSL